jgi:hypothetical protein
MAKDMSTLVAEAFAERLNGVDKSIRADNPVGFGKERLAPNEYKKRLLNMTKQERIAEIDSRGIDVVANALRDE